jgi:hypothetical protein
VGRRLGIVLLTVLGGGLLTRPVRAAPGPDDAALAERVLAGVQAALRGERAAIQVLERVAVQRPELPGLAGTIGTAALLLGDLARAQRVLGRLPELAAYRAMALASGPGGGARARTVLAEHAARPDASADVLFLAALAFFDAKQRERADALLERAVLAADGPLDLAFAPDPGVAMSRQALRALRALGAEETARPRLAMALLNAHRRGEALRLAEASLGSKLGRDAGLRVLVLIENAVWARRTLDRVRRVRRDEPDSEDARVAEVVLELRAGRPERARALAEALPPIDDPELAALALGGADPEAALELAEAATRADPKSNANVALLVRALLGAGKIDRAEAFAGALLKRKPTDADPFALLAAVARARRQERKAREMDLRSAGFTRSLADLEAAVKAREAVLRGARDAQESALAVTGLEALRGEHAALSLPIDLALARHADRGWRRSARDRILAACGPRLKRLLLRTEGWDQVEIRTNPYGEVQRVEAPLSGADPARCRAPAAR